jgi:hypothetical protein
MTFYFKNDGVVSEVTATTDEALLDIFRGGIFRTVEMDTAAGFVAELEFLSRIFNPLPQHQEEFNGYNEAERLLYAAELCDHRKQAEMALCLIRSWDIPEDTAELFNADYTGNTMPITWGGLCNLPVDVRGVIIGVAVSIYQQSPHPVIATVLQSMYALRQAQGHLLPKPAHGDDAPC